jgi:hypothetical protein
MQIKCKSKAAGSLSRLVRIAPAIKNACIKSIVQAPRNNSKAGSKQDKDKFGDVKNSIAELTAGLTQTALENLKGAQGSDILKEAKNIKSLTSAAVETIAAAEGASKNDAARLVVEVLRATPRRLSDGDVIDAELV